VCIESLCVGSGLPLFLLLAVPFWDELRNHFLLVLRRQLHQLFLLKVKQSWQFVVVRQPCARYSQLVKEGMLAGIEGRKALTRLVNQDLANQINRLHGGFRAEHFIPVLRLDRWELELAITGVHAVDLVSTWRSQDFDDFDELVDA